MTSSLVGSVEEKCGEVCPRLWRRKCVCQAGKAAAMPEDMPSTSTQCERRTTIGTSSNGGTAMATSTTTITATDSGPKYTHHLPHHDDSYLPISRYMTIDGLLKAHAAESDQRPLICYPRSGTCDYEEHTAADIDRFTDAAVQYYQDNGFKPAVCLHR